MVEEIRPENPDHVATPSVHREVVDEVFIAGEAGDVFDLQTAEKD